MQEPSDHGQTKRLRSISPERLLLAGMILVPFFFCCRWASNGLVVLLAPIPEAAQDLGTSWGPDVPGFLRVYEISSPPHNVVAFYQETLPTRGWKVTTKDISYTGFQSMCMKAERRGFAPIYIQVVGLTDSTQTDAEESRVFIAAWYPSRCEGTF